MFYKKFFLYTVFLIFTVTNLSASNQKEDRFCLITVAKGGTHLAKKLLESLSEKKGHFVFVPPDVKRLQGHSQFFLWAHFHQVNTSQTLLNLPRTKFIFFIRDLKDVAIARTCRCIKEQHPPFPKQTPFIKKWLDLSFNDKISALFKPAVWGTSTFLSESLALNHFLHLFQKPHVYVSSFEKLIGPKGGGSIEMQIQEIMNIAQFLEIPITKEDAIKIGQELFGGTVTFRKGQIGEWKQVFNKENSMLFKKYLGKLQNQLGYK